MSAPARGGLPLPRRLAQDAPQGARATRRSAKDYVVARRRPRSSRCAARRPYEIHLAGVHQRGPLHRPCASTAPASRVSCAAALAQHLRAVTRRRALRGVRLRAGARTRFTRSSISAGGSPRAWCARELSLAVGPSIPGAPLEGLRRVSLLEAERERVARRNDVVILDPPPFRARAPRCGRNSLTTPTSSPAPRRLGVAATRATPVDASNTHRPGRARHPVSRPASTLGEGAARRFLELGALVPPVTTRRARGLAVARYSPGLPAPRGPRAAIRLRGVGIWFLWPGELVGAGIIPSAKVALPHDIDHTLATACGLDVTGPDTPIRRSSSSRSPSGSTSRERALVSGGEVQDASSGNSRACSCASGLRGVAISRTSLPAFHSGYFRFPDRDACRKRFSKRGGGGACWLSEGRRLVLTRRARRSAESQTDESRRESSASRLWRGGCVPRSRGDVRGSV